MGGVTVPKGEYNCISCMRVRTVDPRISERDIKMFMLPNQQYMYLYMYDLLIISQKWKFEY